MKHKNHPPVGTPRIVTKFLFLPKRLPVQDADDYVESRWLIIASWRQVYELVPGKGYRWTDVEWVDLRFIK